MQTLLGPVFWRTVEPETLTAYPYGWPQRIKADVRQRDVWVLGGAAAGMGSAWRVRAAQDWGRLLSKTLCRYPMPERP